MIKETVFCDCCTREKKDVNAWWQYHEDHQRDMLGHVLTDKPKLIIVRPYEEDLNRHSWQATCGIECLIKMINGYIRGVLNQGAVV